MENCILLLLDTFGCGDSFFFLFNYDQGVTLTYQKEGYTDTENDLNQLIEIINKTDLTKKQIQSKLKDHRLFEYMDFKADTVSLDRVTLIFENEKLKTVTKQW